MNSVIFSVFSYAVTPWSIVGAIGVVMFALRWVVQIIASSRARQSIVPIAFWHISAIGSLLLILYFGFGRQDPIGFASNLFPLAISLYNLWMVFKVGKIGSTPEIQIEEAV
ncbi:MAG TPA: lipid-A-disaccharide synthase N-terminal domain-containing protein [Candidatus Paceibacterota bacterium]